MLAVLVGWLALVGQGEAQVQEETTSFAWDEPIPPSPYDRVYELEITADDPELIEGRGPTVVAEYEVEFSGTLHLWAESSIDLFLRVEDPMTGAQLAEDDDSGGGKTPYVNLAVEPGDYLAILVAVPTSGQVGPCELHAVASLDTKAARGAAAIIEERAVEIQRLREAGDLAAARTKMRIALNALVSTPGIERSHRVASVLDGLGSRAEELGDLQSAASLRGLLSRVRQHTLPPDHYDLHAARLKLATTLKEVGEYMRARELEESVVAGFERTLGEDHRDLLVARTNLAGTIFQLGDLEEARVLFESVLDARERALPSDHYDVLSARLNVASTLHKTGDLAGARAVYEPLMESLERVVAKDDPTLLRVRQNLAIAMKGMGDLIGGRVLEEAALDTYERALPADHPEVIRARINLANTMTEMGDLADARALQESLLRDAESTLSLDHPFLLGARSNLANTLSLMGEYVAARDLYESVLATYELSLPADLSLPKTLYGPRNAVSDPLRTTVPEGSGGGNGVLVMISGCPDSAICSTSFAYWLPIASA